MMREAKTQSIRARFFGVLAAVCLSFLCVQAATLLVNYRVIQRNRHVLELELSYNLYPNRLEALQNEVTAFFNGNMRSSSESVLTLCEEFAAYEEELLRFFLHPQFIDNSHIVDKYLDTIRTFLERYPESSSAEQLSIYNQTTQMYTRVSQSYQTTAEFFQDSVNQSLTRSTTSWRNAVIVLFLCSFAVILLSVLISRRVIHGITEPILALTGHCRHILQKDYSLHAPSYSGGMPCTETEILTTAYTEMVDTILSQMERLKEQFAVHERLHNLEVRHMKTEMALRQTEVCLMQSLISPHFLFNCMSTLSSIAFLENAPDTENCAILLSMYLREFLDRIGKTVTLREEAAHTQKYIDIQNYRFGKRMTFLMTLSPEVEEVEVPALILQPVIENSLSHGLKNRRRDGKIVVRIRGEERDIVIEISDNGDGITDEEIERVEAALGKPFETGERGIGLRSVYYRLNDRFPDRVSLHLFDTGGGTRTEIRIRTGAN